MKNDAALLQSRPHAPTPTETRPADGDASTRRRVLASIMEHGPSTAAALSERLNLTPAAVRRHLAYLAEHGLLTSREQRVYGTRGRGRPAKVFLATDAGRQDFHQAYDALAVEALEFLAEAGGPEAVASFARARSQRLEERYRERMAQEPAIAPAEALAAALTADGFMASVEPMPSGDQLCQHHCPVAHVAERFPQLCAEETAVIARLLGSHVQRLATIAHGDGVCTTHVPHARAAGSASPTTTGK